MASSGNGSSSWIQLALRVGIFSLRYRPWRRKLMFYLTLGAMGQLALGMILLEGLAESIPLFVCYWGFCGMVVCTMLLLAVYDMLAVRQEQRMELQKLRERMFVDQRETLAHADDSEDAGKT